MARPAGQTAGEPRDQCSRLTDHRARIWHELQHIVQEPLYPLPLRACRSGRQDTLDDRRQLLALTGIDDTVGSHAGGFNFFDLVVGAIEQIVDAKLFAVVAKALAQRRHRAQYLVFYQLGLVEAGIALCETFVGFCEKSGFLFDQQQASVRRQHNEIDLAVH